MALRDMLTLLPAVVLVLAAVCTADPGPQYYPLPFGGQQGQQAQQAPQPAPQHSQDTQHWPQSNHNLSGPGLNLDPVSYSAADDILRNDIPRQLYGPPPPPSPFIGGGSPYNAGPSYGGGSFPSGSSYPQIYKLDNLIIIANPPQAQPCIPQRPPPDFPRPGPDDGSVEDRFGEKSGEPSKCTWAIVACCSPGNNNVRYNCFELLGCPGFFFDNSPCDPTLVMQASQAALDYYSRSANTSGPAVDTNRV